MPLNNKTLKTKLGLVYSAVPVAVAESKFLYWHSGLVLWHTNHYRLFDAKFIFIHINNAV